MKDYLCFRRNEKEKKEVRKCENIFYTFSVEVTL